MGVSGEISLVELSAMTATVSGAGILGEYETAVIGMFQNMSQEVPFRMVNKAELVFRSSIQNVNRSTGGTLSTAGMRIVMRGRVTGAKPGQLKQADLMNASVTLSLTYLLIEVGGEKKLELDKLNDVYVVNGRDLLADVRRQC